MFSSDDIELAIEALQLSKLDVKEREDKKRREREAELLKQKMIEDEERRRAAASTRKTSGRNQCNGVTSRLR